ncbi:hypothetical protein OOJ96_23295 [Pseudomonas sp. 15FMM2]|uniref:Uncharacterized protein n=1 Tax=Pseudomonas imrae TaxID=2992837 RepID=A0ACC7PJ50_9PSED
MTEGQRYDVQTLTTFLEQLFEKAGADAEVAQVVTRVLLEGVGLSQRVVDELNQTAGQLQLPALSQ